MARRNPVRYWLAASLLALSTAAVFATPAPPAGAVDNNYVDVILTANGFIPSTVYARPGDLVRFNIDTSDPSMTRKHTVTLEAGRCDQLPNQLCEKRFDDPRNPFPTFRFSTSDTYPYFDREARDAGDDTKRGTIVISDQPPVTTTTAPPTATTRPPTTTTTAMPRGTTTTTAGSFHPLLVENSAPAPTTTTTTPAHLTVTDAGAAPAKAPNGAAAAAADAGKGKGKAAGSTTTTTTAPPAEPDASIFDPASLTPGAALAPAAVTDTQVDDVTSTAADLLHGGSGSGGDTRLLIIAVAALAAFLLGGCAVGWFRRSSRYFPA